MSTNKVTVAAIGMVDRCSVLLYRDREYLSIVYGLASSTTRSSSIVGNKFKMTI